MAGNMYWSVAFLICFGCHCCSSGTVAQPQGATSPSSATATSASSGPAPTTPATTSQPQSPTSAPPTQNTTGTPTATTQTTPLTALTTTVKPTSAPTLSNSGTGGTKSSTASTGNASGTILTTSLTSASISATTVTNGANPTTPAPTGSSSKPSGSSPSASSSTVKLDQCYKHTCNDTAKGCMAENLNMTIGIDKCLRNDKYCKITLTIKDKLYSIEADCVDGPCDYDDITDNAGQRISNCCKENLCNDESILKGSANRAWHGYLPCLVAVISAAYYFA